MNTQEINTLSAPQFEKTVIGALLNEPNAITEIVNILTPECFYEPNNAKIYGIIIQMYDEDEQIDLYTVSQRCKVAPELEKIKISSYLAQCTQSVGSGMHITSHAQVVKNAYIRRNLIASAHQIIAKASDPSEDISEILAYLSKVGDSNHEIAVGGTAFHHIGESVSNALKQAEKRQTQYRAGIISGVSTGLSDLDRMTGGWQPSQLIILAARPAMGKTALMLHFAKSAAMMGVPVCIYSLEMSDISLANRLLLSECEINTDSFRSGNLTSLDWQKLEAAAVQLKKLAIYVDDNPMVSMRYIKAHSKIMQKRGKCGLILVDYLQLADTAADKKNRNREQEIAQASRQAKIIAKELSVPFVLLSQLSRECEKRGDKIPQLSDLRESGAIEQDADIVSFVFRPAYYRQETIRTQSYGEIPTKGVGFLVLAKQRDGATGMVAFRHNPSMNIITNYDYRAIEVSDEQPF